MMKRRITEASPFQKSIFVTLSCGHKRCFGGGVYQGRLYLPSELIGMPYTCDDGHCGGQS